MTVAPQCPGCDHPTSFRLFGASVGGTEVPIHRCAECGLVYSALWSEEFDSTLYEYYGERLGEDPRRRQDPLNTVRHHALLDSFARQTTGRRLLDVGCGEGHFLQSAGQAGWRAQGIDLSASAIRICEQLGLDASCTDFFDSALDDSRFDVVFMSELIEHVPSADRFFSRALELLDPGGVLYLTTPNFGSLTRRLVGSRWSALHPEHLVYYERRTLDAAIRRTWGQAAEELRITTRNVSPAEILSRAPGHATSTPSAPTKASLSTLRHRKKALRRVVVGNPVLRLLKDGVDRVLSVGSAGDTLVARAVKRRRVL